MSEVRKNIRDIVTEVDEETLDFLNELKSDWVDKSSNIALRILNEIHVKQSISRKDLADKLNTSPQYISKVLSGNENLSLKTISKFEKALGISLIEVTKDSNENKTFEVSEQMLFSSIVTDVKVNLANFLHNYEYIKSNTNSFILNEPEILLPLTDDVIESSDSLLLGENNFALAA